MHRFPSPCQWPDQLSPSPTRSQPLEQAKLYYDKQADRDESERNDPNYVIVSHRYQVLRYLPSPVQAVNVSFLVPVNMTKTSGEQVRFLDLYRPEATIENRRLSCSIQTGYYLAKVSAREERVSFSRTTRVCIDSHDSFWKYCCVCISNGKQWSDFVERCHAVT